MEHKLHFKYLTAMLPSVMMLLSGCFATEGESHLDSQPDGISNYSFNATLRAGFLSCGASVIGREWILTAAECDSICEKGSLSINRSHFSSEGTQLEVDERFQHPNYDSKTKDYNFRLIKLKNPIAETNEITPIDINLDDVTSGPSDKLKVTGWSRLSDEPFDVGASVARVTVDSSSSSCKDNEFIDSTMLCADVSEEPEGAMMIPAGGPIFYNNDGTFTQTGIVSGYYLSDPEDLSDSEDFITVYSRISVARDWIKETVCTGESEHKPKFCDGYGKDGDDNAACYWLEKNSAGTWTWVSAENGGIYNTEGGKEQCYQLDSCDGGKGRSKGGCYKWSVESDGERIPWDGKEPIPSE